MGPIIDNDLQGGLDREISGLGGYPAAVHGKRSECPIGVFPFHDVSSPAANDPIGIRSLYETNGQPKKIVHFVDIKPQNDMVSVVSG